MGVGVSEASEEAEVLTVAAAANLRFVLVELEKDYERKNKTKINVILASSGKLCSQISNGAPFDVFMSANMKFPHSLVEENMTSGKPVVYALGSLILWTVKLQELNGGLNRLLESDIDKIAIATDKNAPYGKAALEALKASNIYDKVKSKLVYGESVSQVNQYIVSESVEVGITNKSVVIGKMEGQGTWVEIDHELYAPIKQGFVITKYGEKHHLKESKSFHDYLFTESAQKIFAKYGYLAP